MKLIKLILVIVIAITLGLSITLTMRSTSSLDYQKPEILYESASKGLETPEKDQKVPDMPSKRVTRFLADERNPRAADHCNKDYALCYILQGKNYTCCNNKCTDLQNDDKHCGFCKNKCKFTQTCCRGECVYLSLDKRHCGACGNRCRHGEYCVYGMCSYSQ